MAALLVPFANVGFFGWVSDHIGRENTMFIAFLVEATSASLTNGPALSTNVCTRRKRICEC
jgi:hypothetical protein